MMLSNYLILCCPLILLHSSFPTIRVFSREWAVHSRWPKYWSCSFSISPCNEYSGLISFRIDWFDFLAVQGTLNYPTPQFESIHSSALSLHYGSTLTSVHDYWKSYSFDCTDFVGKVMSLFFNTLSRFVIVFLPRSKHLLISWLQSPYAVTILYPSEIKKLEN